MRSFERRAEYPELISRLSEKDAREVCYIYREKFARFYIAWVLNNAFFQFWDR